MQHEEPRSASAEWVADAFPHYRDAGLGLRNHWYPVDFSGAVGKDPVPITLAGERIVLVREGSKVFALQDRCPHRGVPLSKGQVHAPGTVTCAYHAWTYELATGDLVAALTDRPDSKICTMASVRVKTFPVEEGAGLIWVYIGEESPPALGSGIPAELLLPDALVLGTVQIEDGNWRLAAEAGIDEGHARYLHRDSKWSFFREFPAWTKFHMTRLDDGWLVRDVEEKTWSDEYPRVGSWPPKVSFYKSRAQGATQIGIKLPGVARVRWADWTSYEFYVPLDLDRYRLVMLAVIWPRSRWSRWSFLARWFLYIRWLYNGAFHAQDTWMIESMQIPPERLYGPDKSITAWRKMCDDDAGSSREDRAKSDPMLRRLGSA